MSQSRNDSAKVAGATYTRAGQGYFEKRTLKRSAGIWGLWGLAVAAVISGDFSGWNFGIGFAGFGGMLIAFVILVAMYYGMIFSIGEMAAAMPHTGGAYSFARSAMGPWGGLVTGAAETIEYVATTAVIVYFSASYADAITSELLNFSMPTWVWWIILYAVFIALNAAGAAISFKFAIVVSIISIGIILVFSVMALFSGAVQLGQALWDIVPDPGQTGIPAARRAADPVRAAVRDVVLPRHRGAAARRRGVAQPGARHPPGRILGPRHPHRHRPARAVPQHRSHRRRGHGSLRREPLLDGFRAIVGDELAAMLALFALIGLLASLQGIMFAYGRNMYSLSRAGYYPKFLSLTGKRQTPWVALAVGAVIGFIALVVLDTVAALNEGAGGGRRRDRAEHRDLGRGARLPAADGLVHHPAQEVPEREPAVPQPVGHPRRRHRRRDLGADLRRLPSQPESARPAIIAIAVVYVVILIGFALFFRHRLVLSPEEEYALSEGKHWDPQAEGYDAMETEVFGDKPKS